MVHPLQLVHTSIMWRQFQFRNFAVSHTAALICLIYQATTVEYMYYTAPAVCTSLAVQFQMNSRLGRALDPGSWNEMRAAMPMHPFVTNPPCNPPHAPAQHRIPCECVCASYATPIVYITAYYHPFLLLSLTTTMYSSPNNQIY